MPGLDGLRALAVAAVLLYHQQARWLPGGFLGVDVFFVLSGFLITSLLLAEHARTGRIDLVAFWRRRARRLVPLLAVVLVAVLAAAALLVPGQLHALRLQALAAVFYVANWHDIAGSTSYFAQFGRPPLLRHLWSLAVEEQFYLAWPVLVLLALRGRRGGPGRVAAVAGVLAFASVAALLLLAGHVSLTRVYEGTDTRAFALLAGAGLAVAWPAGRAGALPVAPAAARALDGCGALALLALALLATRLHDDAAAPLSRGLVAAAAATVVLVAVVAHPAARLGRLLAVAPLRWLGRRSYGIYLWHWPVIALTRPAGAGYGTPLRLALAQVAITLVLSAATFRWIEEPVRRDGLRRSLAALGRRVPALRPPGARVAVAGAAAAALLALALVPARPAAAPAWARGHRAQADAARTARWLRAPATGSGTGAGARRHRAEPRRAGRSARASRAAPAAPPRGTLVVGDSVVLATEAQLTRRLPAPVRVDAAIGRQPQDIVDEVGRWAAARRLPANVVVSIGDNGLVTGAQLRQLRALTARARRVVLVTPRVPRSWGEPSAAAIRHARTGWPAMRVADWQAVAADRDDLFSDGVHPTPGPGARLYAAVVNRALRTA